ncbi:acyltransferase Pun1-like [Bidens hawaiensis]|uniref:acyltransferase Pun1-like n=1 Tax=Bidens hawaiensis TaxID=980011 RepID=UPI00404A9951
MNRMMANIQRFGRLRKPHSTIISQETIKPSSPTPPHLKKHNLSLIDYLNPDIHMPIVFFYPNYNNSSDKNILKKSLSLTLTQYYPFAGRLPAPSAPHIDCRDGGVEFIEASIDTQLDDFILKKDPDESLDQLIPNALGCAVNKTSPNMAAVQLSHFSCGGAAVAVSVSHKVADGFTFGNFVNHWAAVTRGGQPSIINPHFFSSSLGNFKVLDFPESEITGVTYATRRFVFPNSKINELKSKINTMGGYASPLNPTRAESLTALLFKCAAATKSGSSSLNRMVSLRGRTAANFPKLALGNLFVVTATNIKDSSQVELNDVISSMRKEIMELQGVKEVDEIGDIMVKASRALMSDQTRTYTVTSLCRFPFFEADFGWGKPARVMIGIGSVDANMILLMDTPCGDGIEATVKLEEEEMSIFQKNKELHEYVQDI